MSKKIFTILLTAFVFVCLAGCTPEKPDLAAILGDMDKIEVLHVVGGMSTEWTAEGEDAEAIKAWGAGLEFEKYDGVSPGESDGGEFYEFSSADGTISVSYISGGPDDFHLLIDSQWYSVSNPSDPPTAP